MRGTIIFPLIVGAIAAILFAVFAAGLARPAKAQGTICGPRLGIVEALKGKFNEHQNGIGVVNQATVFELYVSAGGSWTMLATNTAGISCIVGSGTGWQAIAVKPARQPGSAS